MKDKVLAKTAFYAKQLGFDMEVHGVYWFNDERNDWENDTNYATPEIKNWNAGYDNVMSAPTQEELHCWLRKNHDLWIFICFGYQLEWKLYKVDKTSLKHKLVNYDGICFTYEECMEEALEYALKFLKDEKLGS